MHEINAYLKANGYSFELCTFTGSDDLYILDGENVDECILTAEGLKEMIEKYGIEKTVSTLMSL